MIWQWSTGSWQCEARRSNSTGENYSKGSWICVRDADLGPLSKTDPKGMELCEGRWRPGSTIQKCSKQNVAQNAKTVSPWNLRFLPTNQIIQRFQGISDTCSLHWMGLCVGRSRSGSTICFVDLLYKDECSVDEGRLWELAEKRCYHDRWSWYMGGLCKIESWSIKRCKLMGLGGSDDSLSSGVLFGSTWELECYEIISEKILKIQGLHQMEIQWVDQCHEVARFGLWGLNDSLDSGGQRMSERSWRYKGCTKLETDGWLMMLHVLGFSGWVWITKK